MAAAHTLSVFMFTSSFFVLTVTHTNSSYAHSFKPQQLQNIMEGRSDSPHEAAAQPSENIVADSQMMDTVTKFATKAPDYTFVFQVDRSLTDQDLQRLRQARLILFSLRNNNVWTLVVVLPLYKYTFHYDWAATGTDGMKSKVGLTRPLRPHAMS